MNLPILSSNIVSVLLVVVILIFLLIIIVRLTQRGNQVQLAHLQHRYHQLRATLSSIKRDAGIKDHSNVRDIFVQVDVWMGQSLQYFGITESTVGGKLKSERLRHKIEKELLNDLWRMHKVRNQVVHEDHVPTKAEIEHCEQTLAKLHKMII